MEFMNRCFSIQYGSKIQTNFSIKDLTEERSAEKIIDYQWFLIFALNDDFTT